MVDLTPPTPPEPSKSDDSANPDSINPEASEDVNSAEENASAPVDSEQAAAPIESIELVEPMIKSAELAAPATASEVYAPGVTQTVVAAGPPRAVYATFWRRFWAYQVDLFIVVMLAGAFIAIARGENAALIALAFWALYFVGFTAEGGTPGKRMFGLRLARLDGSRPGFGRAALREIIGRPISSIPLYLGYLWMLDDASRQTWHDRIADTIVVREVPVAEGPDWAASPPWIKTRADSM